MPDTVHPDLDPATWAAILTAVDPGLGGLVLAARASPQREDWVRSYLALTDRPHRRIGPATGDDRLFGGLDLTATLSAGKPVYDPGVLAALGSGTVVLPMAERLAPDRAARLTQAWDDGATFTILALDESTDDDGPIPPALLDRLAFHVTLPHRHSRSTVPAVSDLEGVDIARSQSDLKRVAVPADILDALVGTAAALGIASLRAPMLAVRAARAIAAVQGERIVTLLMAEQAAALVLAPRATQLPQTEEEEAPDPPPPDDPADRSEDSQVDQDPTDTDRLPQDLILEAVRASIPADLLAKLIARGTLGRQASAAGAGNDQRGATRGRPAGHRPGDPRSGARLDLVATLNAAAPWQPLRRKYQDRPADHLRISPEDFRLRRFRQKTEKVVVFVVDASGSAALARLAETKGAIELMLAEAYVRREQVALIAFRGVAAEVLLPPTRSLVQAKRRLTGLPGGGGTPLATGLEAAFNMAMQIKRRGQTAHLAVLTDGRANIARDGSAGRAQAMEDAHSAARAIRGAGLATILIDTGTRPADTAQALAREMAAAYLALPRADARVLAGTLQSALDTAA